MAAKIKFDFDSKDPSGLVSKHYVDQKILDLMGDENLNSTLDTLKEIAQWIDDDPTDATELTVSLAELTKDVSEIDTTVAEHTNQIGEIDTTVDGHTTQIGAINTTVAGHTTDITNINTEITTINTRLTWEVIA